MVPAPRILAVDDNPDNLTTLKAVVADALPDARVQTALNGPQGIALARAEDPDVILLDIVMPGMDGFEVCRQLKADERLRAIPVLFLTALRADAASRIRALEVGAEGFLSKPLDEHELLAQIRAMAKIKAANRAQRLEREQLEALVAERTRQLEEELAERKQMQEALRIKEQAIESALNSMALTDAAGDLTYVNAAFLKLWGYSSKAEVLGKRPPSARAFWKSPERAVEAIRTVFACGGWSGELEAQAKDGHVFTVQVAGSLVAGDAGQPVGILASFADITERVAAERRRAQAEEALRDGEAQFRAIFDASPVPIVFYDAQGFPLSANRACLTEMGAADVSQLRGVSLFDSTTLPLDLLAEVKAGRAVRREVMYDREHIWRERGLRGPQQGRTYRDVQITPLELHGQRRYLGQSLDITERKQAEDALRESEERFRATIAQSFDGMLIVDDEAHIVEWNAAQTTIFGYTREEMLGKTLGEFVVAAVPDALTSSQTVDALRERFDQPGALKRSARMHGLQTIEVRHRDGSPRLVQTSSFPIALRDRQLYCAITRDITTERAAEQNYQMLFREMLDGFALHEILLDPQGNPVDYRFLAVNPAFERMTGLRGQDIVGRTVLDVMPGTERHWIETYGRVALTGEPAFFANYAQELGKHFEVTAFRPAPNRFACIFADVTARQQAEAVREKLQAQLQQAQKMESVGRLAGGVAHDFNNMLGVILGHAEMALQQVDPAQPLYADLQEIQKAAQRSADLTRQLLAFARRQTVAPKVLDLNATVANTLKMLRRLIGEHIDLVWNPGFELWAVRMDPAQVDQILANLCVNARDAIAGAGRVTLATENVTLDAAAMHSIDGAAHGATHAGARPGEYVRLTVSDDGCGMSPEVLEHLFEPFFTTKGVGQGTGLGLATVYGAVQQNQGHIDVQSVVGEGTTFHLYLPRCVGQEAADAATTNAREVAQRGSETVLLVEDEPAILRMTKVMLTRSGYRVLAARTPREALWLAAEEARKPHVGDGIDLLLTDVVMPEMNGRELAQELRALYPNLKRVFMSGYTADVIASHGVVEEGVYFIQKPFALRDLAAKVREALEGK